ncbi:ABC transporter permease [Micromonospora sp. NPDC051925]|uniref:ABC transporter permease n=1 Tax=Micromonospora sp. NPDC051925 TaxID=3364288 RepID=UPI0037C6E7E0
MAETTVAAAPKATGQVVGVWRAAALRVEACWRWYRRSWRTTLQASALQPLLFLGAMGLCFGSQVQPGPATGGHPYLQYIAPALMVSTVLTTAVAEAGKPVLSSFQWQRDFIAVTATPVTPGQLFAGQLLWITLRLFIGAVIFLLIGVLLGGWASAWAILAVPVAVLAGAACAAPVAAFAATIRGDGHGLVAINRFVVLPMTLFAGTFFPVSALPLAVRPIAWISPLWHGTELARGLTLGGLSAPSAVLHTAFLVALLTVGVVVARRQFYRRLVV